MCRGDHKENKEEEEEEEAKMQQKTRSMLNSKSRDRARLQAKALLIREVPARTFGHIGKLTQVVPGTDMGP